MKKYLYDIDAYSIGKSGKYRGVHVQGIPFMPRVFAEKTVKILMKEMQRTYGRHVERYKVSKTGIETQDGTPHGWNSWYDYRNSWNNEN